MNSYNDLPDAPWIRDAEINGYPEAEDFSYSCPVCGADQPEDFIFDQYGEVIGCECCTKTRNAYEYMAQRRADEQRAG